jgi:hypothetical protein
MRFLPNEEIKSTDGEKYRIISADEDNKTYKVQTPWGKVIDLPQKNLEDFFWSCGLAPISEYPAYLPAGSYCYHDWKRYTGFLMVYEYCTKCDEKRAVPNE